MGGSPRLPDPATVCTRQANNDRASANAIAHGDVIRGSITRRRRLLYHHAGRYGDHRCWTAAAQGGQNMDTYIEMYQEGKKLVAFNDDQRRSRALQRSEPPDTQTGPTIRSARFQRLLTGDYQIHLELLAAPT